MKALEDNSTIWNSAITITGTAATGFSINIGNLLSTITINGITLNIGNTASAVKMNGDLWFNGDVIFKNQLDRSNALDFKEFWNQT